MPRARTLLTAGVLFFSGLFLTAMACTSLLQALPVKAPTPVPATATAVPTETALPLYQQVGFKTTAWEEHDQLSSYEIKVQMPVLIGSDDPRVQAFNNEVTALVDSAVADFKQKLSELAPTPLSSGSSFDLRFNVLSPPGSILSLKFDIQTYFAGAAHPGDVSRTINFDLDQGRDLELADLFIPDSDFLNPISKYCIAQLNTRDIGFQGFELGATASPENYRRWNITADGLMITFDEYQVAPYAAGPQTVVVPYRQLAQLIRPDGPLASYLR